MVDEAKVLADVERAADLNRRANGPVRTDDAHLADCELSGMAVVLAGHCRALLAQNSELRAGHSKLHARTQSAEAAMADMRRCCDKIASGAAWVGGSLGRALLAYDNARLRERVAELEAGLAPFAEYGKHFPVSPIETEFTEYETVLMECTDAPNVTLGDCRRAAALLAPKGG